MAIPILSSIVNKAKSVVSNVSSAIYNMGVATGEDIGRVRQLLTTPTTLAIKEAISSPIVSAALSPAIPLLSAVKAVVPTPTPSNFMPTPAAAATQLQPEKQKPTYMSFPSAPITPPVTSIMSAPATPAVAPASTQCLMPLDAAKSLNSPESSSMLGIQMASPISTVLGAINPALGAAVGAVEGVLGAVGGGVTTTGKGTLMGGQVVASGRKFLIVQTPTGRRVTVYRAARRHSRFYPRARSTKMDRMMELAMIKSLVK